MKKIFIVYGHHNTKDSFNAAIRDTFINEAERLGLEIEKARQYLGWEPKWNFAMTIERTITWYKEIENGGNPYSACVKDIQEYNLLN